MGDYKDMTGNLEDITGDHEINGCVMRNLKGGHKTLMSQFLCHISRLFWTGQLSRML
jgi:hypothetical protein